MTKFDRTNQWLTLAANFAVLVGIILVIIEMNQNQTMMKSQVRNDLSTKIVDILLLVAEDEDLAQIRRKAEAGDSLTVDEAYRFGHLTFAFFRYWENVHFQYRNGLYDEGEFHYHMEAIMGTLAEVRPVREIWCKGQHLFSEEFRVDVNERIQELRYPCKQLVGRN